MDIDFLVRYGTKAGIIGVDPLSLLPKDIAHCTVIIFKIPRMICAVPAGDGDPERAILELVNRLSYPDIQSTVKIRKLIVTTVQNGSKSHTIAVGFTHSKFHCI